MMNIHGTTNIGMLCEDGVVLGNDSRITTSYMDGKTEIHELLTDEEVKIFQISSKPNIVCTLMGDVKEWHIMYTHMLKVSPKSVSDAILCAKKYFNDYLAEKRKERKKGKVPVEFGTIIAGLDEKEGFQVVGVALEGEKLSIDENKTFAIGSGASVIKKLIRQSVEIRSKDSAVLLTLKLLLKATFTDKPTGGKFRVTYVHKDGCVSHTYQVLNVYHELFDVNDEEATLLLIYSTHFGPIFGADVDKLEKELWPRGLKNVAESNIIAKKKDFYVHRIKLSDAAKARKAFRDLSKHNTQQFFPASLIHIQSYLIRCIRSETRDYVYVGMSCKELLQGLCQLKDADTLSYL